MWENEQCSVSEITFPLEVDAWLFRPETDASMATPQPTLIKKATEASVIQNTSGLKGAVWMELSVFCAPCSAVPFISNGCGHEPRNTITFADSVDRCAAWEQENKFEKNDLAPYCDNCV